MALMNVVTSPRSVVAHTCLGRDIYNVPTGVCRICLGIDVAEFSEGSALFLAKETQRNWQLNVRYDTHNTTVC